MIGVSAPGAADAGDIACTLCTLIEVDTEPQYGCLVDRRRQLPYHRWRVGGTGRWLSILARLTLESDLEFDSVTNAPSILADGLIIGGRRRVWRV